MKLLIYARRFGGEIDYSVSPALAATICDRGLLGYAVRFTLMRGEPAPDVHRLSVSLPDDDSILDALGTLAHKVTMAQAWAARGAAQPVPPYVTELWERYPHALYRDLLGPEVERAMRSEEGVLMPP